MTHLQLSNSIPGLLDKIFLWVRTSIENLRFVCQRKRHSTHYMPQRNDGRGIMMAGHPGQDVYVNPDTRVVAGRLGRSRGGASEQWWKLVFVVSDAVRPQPQSVVGRMTRGVD